MARVIVTGYMVRYPVAGNMLAFLYYLAGLQRLGHQVAYVEESGWPSACFDPARGEWQDDPAEGLRIVQALLAESGVAGPVAYVNADAGEVCGVTWPELKDMLRSADLLLNVGGVCWLPEFFLCSRRAIVDMDPVFTQLGKFGGSIAVNHQAHFTYGCNIGKSGCSIPTAGVDWTPTLPPVIVDDWEFGPGRTDAPLTTVAHWNAYGSVEWQGEKYGQKDEEFLRLLDVPSRTSQPLELALSGAPREVVQRFRSKGWSIRDPGQDIAATPGSYREYITGSKGEFSAAKNGYVKTRSGWFSDRTVCYLAAGLPAILQDTGFTDYLPHGEGLIGFTNADDAVEAIERVNTDYSRHRHAARKIAEEHFSHNVVLPKLIQRALSCSA
jgi:hypothetical protein